MEEDIPAKDASQDAPKRPLSPTETSKQPPSKRVRLSSSGKEFRKQLKTEQKTNALQRFLQQSDEEANECIRSYLEHGGSALEILQTMEGESGAPPVLAFDVLNRILLQIGAKLHRYQSAAYDACRYFLNTYLTQINKMLGLSSSMKERVVTLKLLTTMVTFWAVLAKDVLLHVNFNPTNLELMTKVGEGKNEARGALIHFITAYLVDGHFPTLSVLLEKKGLMTSIIKGLQFDKADVVVLVLTAMTNHILENASVSKTVKMRTFNTGVVRDLVNLYNWKGHAWLGDQKKNKTVTVDEVDKSKVNEAVHGLLLVLCTSHRFGVIFKDHALGLGKKQNNLMFTVLDSLERPWEHSYAGELVIKICRACPDLARTVWSSVKTSLEPRWTDKWLKSMKFASRLLDELEPECVEFAVNNLSVQQLSQVITILTSPLPVLKTLTPELGFDKPATKYHVLSLFLKMTTSVESFLKRARTWALNYQDLSTCLANHIQRNFPDVQFILGGWDQIDDDLHISDYLDVAFDLLDKYKILSPQILEEWGMNVDVREFLAKSESVIDGENLKRLQVKAVNFFMDLEPALFKSQTELFKNVLLLSFEHYYVSKDAKVLGVLRQLLKNSGVFEGFLHEMDFWVDGVLNLKSYDPKVGEFLCDLVQKSEQNAIYHQKLFEFKKANFSIMVLSLSDHFDDAELSKSVRTYLNFVLLSIFHVQDDSSSLVQIIGKFQHVFDVLFNYVSNWNSLEVVALGKCKGKLMDQFHAFSQSFLEGSLETSDFDFYPNHKLDLLRVVVFYLTKLVKVGALSDSQKNNCSKFWQYLISNEVCEDRRYPETILGNPTLLDNFNVFNINDFSTRFIVEVVKSLKTSIIEDFLSNFRRKVVSTILKVFRKPEKNQNSVVSVEVLENITLGYEQCCKLVTKFVSSLENKTFYPVVCYCLNRMAELGRSYTFEPLSNDTIEELTRFFTLLAKEQTPNFNLVSSSLHNYLKIFPHNLETVDSELFTTLVSLPEFNKDNLSLCEFLLDRKPESRASFEANLDLICSKRSFILALLDVVVDLYQNDDSTLEKIFSKFETHLIKALQKPHKAGQHFQSRYRSVGVLIEKFMKTDAFGTQVQKFETTELFHVYLLKKVFDKIEKNEKVFGNMVMTFVHLLMGLLKQKSGNKVVDLGEVGEVVFGFLFENRGVEGAALSNNETVKTFFKLCLKFGVAGDFVLVKILKELVCLCVSEEEGKLILEMLLSHSQFLDVVLGEEQRFEVLELWEAICGKWPQFMERNHVPILLSAYKATKADTATLGLLKMYESHPDQTKFFDFKPFLWGRAAASHYSVRSDIQQVLWRQPKMSDVLNNLHLGTIATTITDPSHPNSYDLDYFLPLFSHILSPENPVTTYKFTKSGALALTLTGFRGDKSQRLATCHVLQRFYFHLEARQSGKDNPLWLRFIEAICKGVAVLDDFKVNNFVGIFLARMALVMTQPTEVMYVPLSQYLGAKDSLDFSTIPELYTFLHSPHVESKQHKHFILEVLKDGLKTNNDFTTLLRSMGFKLISELCSSTVCDSQTKMEVLEVFTECCKLDLGVKVLCGNLAFLTQVFALVFGNVTEGAILRKLLEILLKIVEVDEDRHRNFLVYLNLTTLSDKYFRYVQDSNSLDVYYRVLMVVVNRFPGFFGNKDMEGLLEKSGDRFCGYLVRYGCRFVKEGDILKDACLRLLFYDKLKAV